MKPFTLGIDIDDTVADGLGFFVEALNEHLGQTVKVEQVRGRLHTSYGVEQAVLDDFFIHLGDRVFTELNPIPLAREKVNQLYAQGHQILFITARPANSKPSTEKWLSQHGFRFHQLVHSSDKPKDCKELGIQIFIDDHPQMVEGAHQAGISSIFVDAPKNWDTEMHPNILRAKNWEEIYEGIQKLIQVIDSDTLNK